MPDDYTSNVHTTGSVAVDGSATGEIDSVGDRDWFAVTLQAGSTYRIDLEAIQLHFDAYLRGIHDKDGDLISGTTNDDGGAGYDSQLIFTATETATYYVAAGAHGSHTGTYKLSVTEIGDDFEAGTGTSGAVEVGDSAEGEIETAGDEDWFAVEFEAGTTYRIDLEGKPTSAGTLRNPFLRGIHDEDGNLIGGTADNNGGEGRNSRLDYTAAEAGTHYIAAGGSGNQTGTYTLSVEEAVDGI